MPRGSPALKLAITVDRNVHAKVLKAAERDHLSVSAWMTEAARRQLVVSAGLLAVAKWETEHGELTSVELHAARVRLADSGRAKATKKPRTR